MVSPLHSLFFTDPSRPRSQILKQVIATDTTRLVKAVHPLVFRSRSSVLHSHSLHMIIKPKQTEPLTPLSRKTSFPPLFPVRCYLLLCRSSITGAVQARSFEGGFWAAGWGQDVPPRRRRPRLGPSGRWERTSRSWASSLSLST